MGENCRLQCSSSSRFKIVVVDVFSNGILFDGHASNRQRTLLDRMAPTNRVREREETKRNSKFFESDEKVRTLKSGVKAGEFQTAQSEPKSSACLHRSIFIAYNLGTPVCFWIFSPSIVSNQNRSMVSSLFGNPIGY